jgi:hypothetical protein
VKFVHDASYLELVVRTLRPLATFDQALRRGSIKAGVESL